VIKVSSVNLLSTNCLIIFGKSFVTLWEVTAHTMGNAGLLCHSVIMCNRVTYFTTFVLVIEFV